VSPAAAITLDASWALPMDYPSYGSAAAPREPSRTGRHPHAHEYFPSSSHKAVEVRVCVWHVRSTFVLTPTGFAPQAVVPCDALASAGTQQLTQNWCEPRGMTN
jgi:hypothetical protein